MPASQGHQGPTQNQALDIGAGTGQGWKGRPALGECSVPASVTGDPAGWLDWLEGLED